MRAVFMGTPAYAATILENLAEHHEVIGVFTKPDAVRGRGRRPVASPVSQVALARSIPVHTPSVLGDAESTELLERLDPDVICVAAYGLILPSSMLQLPRHGCLNVHASILPAWRGAAPIERAILAGDHETGVCIMRMEEGLDTGDYCVVRTTDIADKNAVELTAELAELGSAALLTSLSMLEAGTAEWTHQDDFFATYAEKVAKGEFYLKESDVALEAVKKVQASSPAHPARAVVAERPCAITSAARVTSRLLRTELALRPGEATFSGKRLYLGMEDQPIEVLQIKPDGKRAMDAAAFAAGTQALRHGASWRSFDV